MEVLKMRYSRTDIDKIFSDTVIDYIAQGYWIYTDSMSGSQGEIARVDLTNGVEILRIYLDSAWQSKIGYTFTLYVGRVIKPIDCLGTIWNNQLELVTETVFVSFDHTSKQYVLLNSVEYLEYAQKRVARGSNSRTTFIEKHTEDLSVYEKTLIYNLVLTTKLNQ